jgi:glutamine amidotransferase/cyclase
LQVEKPSDITAADKLIFPGVGSFGQAIEVLQKREYTKPLVEYIEVRPAALQLHSIHD